MATTFDEIYEPFFFKITQDKDFFQYCNVTESDALAIAKTRSLKLLKEAIAKLTLNCTPDVDFSDYNESENTFNFDLSKIEIDLITNLMKEKLLQQDEFKLKAFANRFSPSDLKVFSPAQDRKTFLEMLNNMKEENYKAIKNYAARDRTTGKLKTLKFDYTI